MSLGVEGCWWLTCCRTRRALAGGFLGMMLRLARLGLSSRSTVGMRTAFGGLPMPPMCLTGSDAFVNSFLLDGLPSRLLSSAPAF